MPLSSAAAEIEQKVWKAVSANPDSTAAMLVKRLEDITGRQMVDALNDLLAKDLVKAYKNSDGGLLWKAVNKADAKVKNAMAADERMVYSAIEASGNQGVWSRSIQSSTNLPTAVVTKILTKLVNSKQIKMVKSVKHPTRKMYMLSQIEPSVELTGGPWYTDFELDVEFIKTIKGACLKFIQTQSFPDPDDTSLSAALFSGSKTSIYPSTTDVAKWLRKSRITETELAPEHIQEVLDVLVYDGEVEKLPAFAAGGKHGNGASDDGLDAKKSLNKERGEVGKKRKRKSLSGEESDIPPSPRSESKKRKKRSPRKVDATEDDSTSDPDALGDKRLRPKRKSPHKRGGRPTERESDGDDDLNSTRGKKKKSRKEARNNIDDEDGNSRKISKHQSKRRHRAHVSEDDTLSSNSETSSTSSTSDSDSNADVSSRRSRSRSKRSKSDGKRKKTEDRDSDVDYDLEFGHIFGGDNVYRAIRQERVGLGWSQAPCAKCPQLDFCEDDGPVNPQGCKYYMDWLLQGVEE